MSSLGVKKSDSVENQKSGLKTSPLFLDLGSFCLVFFLALAVRLAFAYLDGHETIVFSCDASEYLRCAQGIELVLNSTTDLWQNSLMYLLGLLPADQAQALHKSFEPLTGMAKQAGPIFPTFLVSSYLLTLSPITAECWYAPVFIHSIFTSLTCVLIGYIASKCWSKKAGLIAGILACFYPGFIVNSLRLYSESYATFWLVCVVALLVQMYSSSKWNKSILLGICLGILQGARSALVLVTGLTVTFMSIFAGAGNRKKGLILVFTGLVLAIAPCMAIQSLILGKSSVVQDRVAHYNIFVGMDVNAQGWLSYPYPDGTGIEKSNYLQLLKRRYEESHSRFLKLVFDKPLRLFKFPWNDFRTPVGIFGHSSLVFYHQFCLLFAAIGICGAFLNLKWGQEADRKKLCMRAFLFCLAGLHTVYFAFITVPRYGLTAMPFVILFASAGIAFLVNRLNNKETRKTALLLSGASLLVLISTRFELTGNLFQILSAANLNSTIATLAFESIIKALIIITFFATLFANLEKKAAKIATITTALIVLPFFSLPLRAHGRALEWKADFNSSDKPATQTILLPENKKNDFNNRISYLLVDGKDWKALGQNASIKINGQVLDNYNLPIMPFSQNLDQPKSRGENELFYECEDIYRAVLTAAGGLNLDIRQWFIVPVPIELLAQAYQQNNPKLEIEIAPLPNRIIRLFGSYSSNKDSIWLPSVARYSWEKCLYGVESIQGFNDSRFDEKYKLATKSDSNKDLSTAPGLQTGSYNLRLLLTQNDAKPEANSPLSASNQEPTPFSPSTTYSTSTSELPAYSEDTIWAVTVSGELESRFDNGLQVPVDFQVNSICQSENNQKSYMSPWVPTSIDIHKGSNKFSFSYPIKPSALTNLKTLSVSAKKGGLADSTQFFGTDYKPLNKRSGMGKTEFESKLDNNLAWSSLTISIREIQGNPTKPGFEIF